MKRSLSVQSIPEDRRNGKIIGYQLQYNGRTVDVDREPQLMATVENIPCNQDVLVHIFARNKAGLSNTSSAILIHAGYYFLFIFNSFFLTEQIWCI